MILHPSVSQKLLKIENNKSQLRLVFIENKIQQYFGRPTELDIADMQMIDRVWNKELEFWLLALSSN